LFQRFTSTQPIRDLPKLEAILAASPTAEGRQWYAIHNADIPEVYIFDAIGEFGVRAAEFIEELREIKAQKVHLRVNSPGGNVFEALAIYNAIRRHKATFEAFVDGVAASAASFVVMAADKVLMSPHSQLFIHDAHGLALGNAGDMREMADFLDKASDNIAAIYAERTDSTVAEWRERMKAESWFSDEEAVDCGLADAIDGREAANKLPDYDYATALRAAQRSKPATPAYAEAIRTGLGRGG